jgi:hypothetical protein
MSLTAVNVQKFRYTDLKKKQIHTTRVSGFITDFSCVTRKLREGRNVYTYLVGKSEGKRPLERPRRRWENRIKMDLMEIGWGGVEWIHLAQVRDC